MFPPLGLTLLNYLLRNHALGLCILKMDDAPNAFEFFEQSLIILREGSLRWLEAMTLCGMAVAQQRLGNIALGVTYA